MTGLNVLSCLSLCLCLGHVLSDVKNLQAVSTANNDFTAKFYQKISKGQDNVISSPFSCSTVLSMLLVGAKGPTANEMKTALDYTDLKQDEINDGYQQIIPGLAGNYTLEVTNAIFVQKDVTVLESFNKTLSTYYQSAGYPLESAGQINSFVAEHTNNKIQNLISELSPDAVMVLINAVYFKGTWKTQFKKADSKDEPFTNAGGGTSNTTMMHVTSKFKYIDSDDLKAQVLALPYIGEQMYMIFILPTETSGDLSETESQLSGTSLVKAFNDTFEDQVIVTIPRFKIESSFDLGKPLMDSGMKLAFGSGADFSGVVQGTKISVSQVLQKAFIEVNEEGSEAAAATAVIAIASGSIDGPPPEPLAFTADRPFIYAIYHQPTNSILFIGKITKAPF